MFARFFTERLFSVRSVKEVLDDAAAGYISVLPYGKEKLKSSNLFSSLKKAGEDVEIMSSLLAGGDVSRLKKYCKRSMYDHDNM